MVEATLLYSQQVQQKVQLESKDSHKTKNGAETYTAYFEVDQPKVWWPHGYGSQPLYEILLHVIGEDGSTVLATESKKIGICRTELVQDDDNFGRSFFFRINGVDVFAGGSCWVPADSFATRVSAERYRDWIRLVRDGNQVMLRVWGGGLYEADAFYDACDELGVLVWQDFAFACANYPAYPDYLRSVEREARQNVQRLRHHPSLIIWAGNNEDYQIVERYGLEYKPEDHDPTSWLKTGFPARYIYEHLLPRVVEEESPGTIYRPSSPWGNGKSTTLQVDPTIGGVHEWNVWNGPMRLLQDLPDMGGRFISEFGMEAYPHVETLRACISDSAQRYPGSMVVDFHNKAVGHERRLGAYLVENYRLPCRLADTVVTDTTAGITGMASNPKTTTTSRQCGGVLAWQLNDCWPCISWSIADSRMVRKPAFYAIRRALQRPLAVGVHRVLPQRDWTMRRADGRLWQRDTGHLDPAAGWRRGESTVFDVWVASSSIGPDPIIAHVVVRFISVSTGADVRSEWGKTVSVMPNQTTEVFSRSSVVVDSREQTRAPGRDFSSSLGEVDPFIIRAIVYVDGRLVSSDTSWPEPIKYLDLRDRGVRLNYNSDNSVAVTAEKPVKGFVFMEEKGVALSDNGFDVIPGEKPKVVRVEGLDVQELEWTFVQE
ncbi:hypothetical protein VTK73DRAFT_3537 [Phialemonium thermophilum]|uniref:Beta-mannosidase B n=1 Tax=Phialemonium thermophilum TaxID=223376 RepID=A0ABR3Y0J6_9PEZI